MVPGMGSEFGYPEHVTFTPAEESEVSTQKSRRDRQTDRQESRADNGAFADGSGHCLVCGV
jgi:hypothetical protein